MPHPGRSIPQDTAKPTPVVPPPRVPDPLPVVDPIPSTGTDSSSAHNPMHFVTFDIMPFLRDAGASINVRDWRNPEYEVYNYHPREDKPPGSLWERVVEVGEQAYLGAKEHLQTLITYLQPCIFKDDFEMLHTLSCESQEIRATRPLTASGTGRRLYNLSRNSFKYWSGWNYLKSIYYENIGHTVQENAVKVAELVPKLITEKAQSLYEAFDDSREKLSRRVAVVLADGQYNNQVYLHKLVEDLENLAIAYRNQTVALDLSKVGEGDSEMKKVQKALDKLLEKGFESTGPFSTRSSYKVNDLKFHLGNFFRRIDKIAGKARGAYYRIFSEAGQATGANEMDRLRNRLYLLTKELYELSQVHMSEIGESRNLVHQFEQLRSEL